MSSDAFGTILMILIVGGFVKGYVQGATCKSPDEKT